MPTRKTISQASNAETPQPYTRDLYFTYCKLQQNKPFFSQAPTVTKADLRRPSHEHLYICTLNRLNHSGSSIHLSARMKLFFSSCPVEMILCETIPNATFKLEGLYLAMLVLLW